MASPLLVDMLDDGEIAVLTLNRPEQLNAINMGLCHALADQFHAWNEAAANDGDGDIPRVVILTGAGKRAFSTGVDLNDPIDAVEQTGTDAPSLRKNPVHQMSLFPNLILGAVNGHCVTGGFELALACDVLLAAANAKFRDTHAKFGLQPCWGLAAKLTGLVGAQRARYVSLTSTPVDARTAERWGIVSHACGPKGDVKAAALALARRVLRLDGDSVAALKRTLRMCGDARGVGRALDVEWRRARGRYVDGAVDGAMAERVTGEFRKNQAGRSRL